ncbi:MAG: flippase-like domain-containing protein [Planctomycetes bacterium]|nr:flippase-like domain-containing protein [Planctomycetota bacterium]
MDSAKTRKVLVWIGQTILAALLIGFVGRSVFSNWTELGTLDVTFRIRPLWILSAALTVWLTYGLLIEAWRRILLGWNQTLDFFPATRIWCLSNLGRYLPGKVWSIAALAVLAQRAGVAGWAAAGSAVVMQAIAIGTGALVVSAAAPGAATPLALAGALCLAGCVVGVLVWEPMVERLGRLARPNMEFRALPVRTAILATVVTLTSWIAYGMAFWMLAKGIFGNTDLSAFQATGVFAAGYIVGLLALFAPGGVGVRELVFVALLAPILGSGGALALSIAARLLLTFTEASAALVVLFVDRRKEISVDTSA